MKAETKITQPHPTLLVVDDDPDLRLAMVRILEQAGYAVKQGASAAEALALTRAHRPALVLLDVALPDGDGRDVARQIKTDPALTGVFVVLVSGVKVSPADQASILADGYILRPVPAHVLLGWVEVLLRLQATQEELRERETLFRTLTQVAPVGIFRTDAAGNCLYVNRRWSEIAGMDIDEAKGQGWLRGLYSEDRARVAAEWYQAAQEQRPFSLEYRFQTPDGSLTWVLGQSAAEIGPTGEVTGYIGAITDITERKQAEEERLQREVLRQREKMYRTVADFTYDWEYWQTPDGRLLYVSPACERITGYQAEEFQQDPGLMDSIVYPEDRERFIKHKHDCMNAALGADFASMDFRIITRTGQVRWIGHLSRQVYDHNGKNLGYRASNRDITERKRAEDALRAASLYTRTLLETSLDPLVTISAEGKITDVNLATEKITGLKRDRLIGSDFADYFTEPETARAGYRQVFVQGQVKDYPLAIRHTSGVVTEVLYNASVYRNEQGEVLGVFATARDITERKQAEAERAKLEAQTRQIEKAESLKRMAGAIAHHFNNQLQAVIGYLELALMATVSPSPDTARDLSQAMTAAHRAAEVSRLMLTYLGQTTDKLAPLDLTRICALTLPILQAAMPKNVTLETDWPTPGPVINANTNQFQQLLTSLVTNSREAIDNKPGRIQLTVSVVSAADIPQANRFPFDWQPQGQTYACLAVADTGSGIAEPDIEKIFDPFFSTKFTGRGLGLAVVLGIVRSCSGLVTVTSQPGRGSIFRLFFPMVAQQDTHLPEQSAQIPARRGEGTMLLVEDDEVVREMVTDMLVHLGYAVLAARDGIEAVDLFRQHQAKIQWVLCDLTMPRMDGWATLTALRKLAPGLPVILASGYSEAQVMAGHHPETPQVFLSKPYYLQGLRDAIGRALRGKNVGEDC